MRVYNYLFYKGYMLGQRNGSFADAPILGGIMLVVGCVALNVTSVLILLKRFGVLEDLEFSRTQRTVFAAITLASVYFYYSFRGRYKSIIKYYQDRNLTKPTYFGTVLTFLVYLGVTSLIAFICAQI